MVDRSVAHVLEAVYWLVVVGSFALMAAAAVASLYMFLAGVGVL